MRDQIDQRFYRSSSGPTHAGVLLMGLSSEAGRLLAQLVEQHQIQKRYHAIVRAG